MFSAGDKVKVKPGTVTFKIWQMLKDKQGVVASDDSALWDCVATFADTDRKGGRFGFRFDQLDRM